MSWTRFYMSSCNSNGVREKVSYNLYCEVIHYSYRAYALHTDLFFNYHTLNNIFLLHVRHQNALTTQRIFRRTAN